MDLTESAEIVIWPEMHYVFVEKTEPIPQNAHVAWQEFHQVLSQLEANNKVTGFMSLYKMEPQVLIVALLFGLIHMKVNPITAAAAFVLGLFSGELKRRSGSLLPAILVHAVFNAFAAIL